MVLKREEYKYIVEMYKRGNTISEISDYYKVTPQRIQQILSSTLTPRKYKKYKGIRLLLKRKEQLKEYKKTHNNLTPEEVRENKELYRRGLRWNALYDACVGCGRTSVPHQARGLCSSCHSAKRYKNKEERKKMVEAQKRYRNKNKDKILEYSRQYYLDHREELIEYAKKYNDKKNGNKNKVS